MLSGKSLYKKIIDLLVNIFKSNDLKKVIIENEKLRKNVVLQINNLLYLEKQHNCTLNDLCYAVEFAQVLVNLTEKEEMIEKHDSKLVTQIEEEYLFLLEYISNDYGQEKTKMIATSDIDDSLIENLWQINESSSSKTAAIIPDIVELIDFKHHQNQNNSFNHNAQGKNKLSVDEMVQSLKFSGSLPMHPKSDPRFYPFKTKPKRMPMLKILLTTFISITLILYFVVLFYTAAKNININKSLLPSSFEFDELWINKTNNRVLFKIPNNINEYDHYYGSSQEKLNINLESLFLFLPAFLLLFATICCGYHLVRHQKKIRNNFSINWYIISFLFINIILVFCYWIFKYALFRFELTSEIPNEINKAEQFNDICNNIIRNSDEFKLFQYLMITASIMAGITVSFLIYLTCINPRIDKDKIKKANLEYEKMLYNALEGKEYIVDADLFQE